MSDDEMMLVHALEARAFLVRIPYGGRVAHIWEDGRPWQNAPTLCHVALSPSRRAITLDRTNLCAKCAKAGRARLAALDALDAGGDDDTD